jgi:hypothetical protein
LSTVSGGSKNRDTTCVVSRVLKVEVPQLVRRSFMIKNLPTSWTKLSKVSESPEVLVLFSLVIPKKTTPESRAQGNAQDCFEVADGLVGALIVAQNFDGLHTHSCCRLEIDSEVIEKHALDGLHIE